MNSNTNNTQQAFWIALGSLFAFGFGIVSSMILSRYFSKSDYGTYKQVLYVYNTLLTVFTLGLPKAYSYFLPRVNERQAKSLIKRITNLFFLLGGIFSVLLFISADLIAHFLKNPDLAMALKIFSPVPFLMLPTMGLDGILATFKMTKFMALYTIMTRTIMLLCVIIPVVFFNSFYIYAIIGFVVASLFSFLIALYFKSFPVKNKGNEPTETTYKDIFKFALPLLTASIWGMLISSADQFFISRYFGNEVFAVFSNGAMELPFVGMIVGATATVLSPIFSRMSHQNVNPQKEIFPVWESVFVKSAMLIYPLLIYSWFFADTLMVVLYGQQYEASAVFFRIKTIVNFFTLIVFAPLIINIGKVKYYSNVHMYGAIMLIALEYLSVLLVKSPVFLIGVSVLCQIIKIFFLLRIVARYFECPIYRLFPLKLIGNILIPSIIILSIEYFLFVAYFKMESLSILFLSFSIYVIVFFLYSQRVKLNYSFIIKPLLNRINK